MRRWLAVLVVFAASGCGLFGPERISGDEVADKVRSFFVSTAGADAKSVTCEGVDAEVGAEASCTAIDLDGRNWPMTAAVTNIEDDRISYTPRFDDRVIDNFTVQANIARALEVKTERYYKTVTCSGIHKLVIDTTRTCTVTETNDNVWNVDYTITDMNGGATVTLQDSVLYAGTLEPIVEDLARRLSLQYRLASGYFSQASASCANMLRGRTGEAVHCTAVLADKSSTDVTIRTTKVEFDKIFFEVFPDNAPDLSLGGWHLADPR